jgi:outer membrane immunogenic protein
MRRLTIAAFAAVSTIAFTQIAIAADMSVKAPFYRAQVFSWTGVYVGGDVGYGWGRSKGTLQDLQGLFPVPYDFHADGIIGGAFIGANYQFGQIVVGVEADWQAADLDGSQTVNLFGGYDIRTKIDNYGSVRGRLGFAWDRWMFFGTGGWAWGHGHTSYGFPGIAPFYTNSFNGHNGWTAGAGFEYAFTNNVLARVEYRYTDLGNHSYVDVPTNSVETGNRITINDVRVGLAFKFW